MSQHDDPPEYIGADKTTLADPKIKKTVAVAPQMAETFNQHPQIDGLEDEPAAPSEARQPAPRVAVYNPPAPGASHPKHAILGPALRVDEAEAAYNRATLELTAATRHLRKCDLAESDAEASLIAELPGPTPDQLLRDHVAAQTRQRAERVARGLPPDAPSVSRPGNSPLDRQAAQRMRTSPGIVSAPLRSTIARR